MQTDLIDLKNIDQQVDVYDLGLSAVGESQLKPRKVGIVQTHSIACGANIDKKFVSAKDWFYSDLNRRLLKNFYQKNKLTLPAHIVAQF